MLPHIKRPTTTATLDFQVWYDCRGKRLHRVPTLTVLVRFVKARQAKKRWQKAGGQALLWRCGSPWFICFFILVAGVFLAMGSFYGVSIRRRRHSQCAPSGVESNSVVS